MRNLSNVSDSVSFPARKSKNELKIAMKTWDMLKVIYVIALLHISKENTAHCLKFTVTTPDPRGGTPYIQMIGMIVVFFRGCNRRFSIF